MPFVTRESLAARLISVRQRIVDDGMDGLLVTYPPNASYLTGIRTSIAAVVIDQDTLTFITDSRYHTYVNSRLQSEDALPGLSVKLIEHSYDETIRDTLIRKKMSRVGVESRHLTLQRWDWLTNQLTGKSELIPTDGIVEDYRIVKDADEISCLRAAGELLARAVIPIFELVRVGASERDIAAHVDLALATVGFEDRAFETIVASGPNSALPHARPSRRRLVDGDLVLLDFGGVYNGYCVDLSRTVCVGQSSQHAKKLHEAVLVAQAAAISAVQPGISASKIDMAARDVLQELGLAASFGHGTGHGLGVEVHEAPYIGRPNQRDPETSDVRLRPGMIFTVEPGVYVPGVGGVRIEDDVLVTESGCEILTEAPRELIVR